MKKGTKILLWVVSIVIFAIIAYWTFMGIALRGAKYTFTTTYPAACWTDDGKQIVYLMNKEIHAYALFPIVGGASVVKSKTYLCIMDADGKNKRVVGEVPEETIKDVTVGPKWNRITMNTKGQYFFMKANGSYKVNLDNNNWEKIGKEYYPIMFQADLNLKNPITNDNIFIGTPLNMSVSIVKIIYNDKKEKILLKNSIKKSYLFIPFWWRV